MKKALLLTASALLVITLAITGVFYLQSLRTVTFSLENVSSVAVFDSKDKEVASLSSDGDIRLQEGKYYVIPSGEGIDTSRVNFTVGEEDRTVSINPPLTEERLEELLEEEMPAIEAAISDKYDSLIDGYTLDNGSLYRHGEWFGGLLKPKVSDPRQRKDPYRIVLHKEDSEWKVIRRPEYVLTSSRYSEVPVEVLRQINLIAQ